MSGRSGVAYQYVVLRCVPRAELQTAMATVAQSVGSNATVLRQREQALRDALAQQHARVLELNRTRDELGVLIKDLDSAQRAFDAASARAFQTRIDVTHGTKRG